MDYFSYGEQEYIPCEACQKQANDIHHIKGRIGKGANDIENLMALCRKHHDMSHNEKIKDDELIYIHRAFMAGQRKVFLT